MCMSGCIYGCEVVWKNLVGLFALKDFDEFRNVFIAKLRYYSGLRLYGCGCMDAYVRMWMYFVRVCGWMVMCISGCIWCEDVWKNLVGLFALKGFDEFQNVFIAKLRY